MVQTMSYHRYSAISPTETKGQRLRVNSLDVKSHLEAMSRLLQSLRLILTLSVDPPLAA